MTLHGLSYLVLLPLVVAALRLLPAGRPRQAGVLAVSYAFYASWGLGFLAVLLLSTALNWFCGAALARRPTRGRLLAGVTLNLLLLAGFKLLPPLSAAWAPDSPLARVLLPVGMSFWTFQALSYLLDRYREEPLDPTPLEFALFLAFWPTVLSGPIARLPELLPQLRRLAPAGWDDLAWGARRIVLGLFFKLVLSGILAQGLIAGAGLDAGFDERAGGWGGIDAWTLAIGFGFQLFFDFAGYSHLAIGSARLLGVELPENFARPYLSPTPAVFWTRWHMSLSFWIRDYVFLPLATLRRSTAWRLGAIFLSMVLFGLWHGATATFLVWGAYHGALLVAHRLIQMGKRLAPWWPPEAVERPLGAVLTFACIGLGWIPFRAHDLGRAWELGRAVLAPSSYLHLSLRADVYIVTFLVVAGYFVVEAVHRLVVREQARPAVRRALWLLAPPYYAALILLAICWSAQEAGFVYLQF
ncbi:MAG TPA: MBOAT family O-acyltransferase [Candidatus Polarisedimenticolaceae bacterium]|nr:MBOAT family O-acyltransferase [Candidatus Polarisedimenticolaceae bacterium]